MKCSYVLLALGVFGLRLQAASSLHLSPGKIGTYTVPSSGPYTALQSFRAEFRIHNFAPCSGNYSNIWDLGPVVIRCFLDGGTDIVVSDGAASRGIIFPLAGRQDVVIRIQRDGDVLRGEVWNADSSGYNFYSTDGVTATPQNVSGSKQVGGPTTELRLAWFRWYSATLPTASRLPLNQSAPGDSPNLGEWRLENSLSDSSGYHLNLSLGSPSYDVTPVYDPVAIVGFAGGTGNSGPGINVVRAGVEARLSGGDSFSFADTTDLQYRWVQLEGPTQLSIDHGTESEISFRNTVFGEYLLRLTVEDALGKKARREFRFGAVATDEQGRILPQDPMVSKVFGPLLRWGLSPWPYADDRQAAFANHFGEALTNDPNYQVDWQTALSGTVSLTNGSPVVNGTGTNFQVDFCGSEGATAPSSTRVFTLWYPLTGGGTGRRSYGVAACDSAERLVLDTPYLTTDSRAGLSYSRMSCLGCWIGGSNNHNYYDNVMAHYSMYYRTGLQKYLEYARHLADRWWISPGVDEGRACTVGGDSGRACAPPRIQAYTGLLWRAHEGRADLWPGLRAGLNVFKTAQASSIYDLREQGYSLAYISVAAMLDPDSAKRQEYRADAEGAVTNLWKPRQHPSGIWLNYSYGFESNNTNPPNTINVQRGSNEIIGNGTQAYWPANSSGLWIQREGDQRAYFTQPGSTSTKLILDRPYEGGTANGQRYQMNVFVGYGVGPFTLGILASGFNYAYLATGSSEARQMLLDTAYWLKQYGIRRSTRGLYYGRMYPPCEPNPDEAPNCVYGPATDNSVLAGERFLNGEVIKAFAAAYEVTQDPELRAAGDLLMGSALGKSGGPQSDGKYALELDETVQSGKAKNYGFWFGFGASPSWQAVRLGNVAPLQARQQHFNSPAVPLTGATSTRVERQAADGSLQSVQCTAATPCALTVDPRHGAATLTLEHQEVNGARIGRSAPHAVKLP